MWAFVGDGEMDEPEALGALGLAAREGLDNLIFVVNCNLQRLDGPVRGNGKIIQELEATFRGAGWHVIKVIWAREWDDLLARDKRRRAADQDERDARRRLPEACRWPTAPTSASTSSAPIHACKALVEHLPDDDLAKLRRGGHDYRKVYAAYAAAVEHTGAPVVILAKTVKGWTLGPGIEGRNVTHQAKKLTQDELKIFRDRLELPIPDEQLKEAPYYHPGAGVARDPVHARARAASWAGSCRAAWCGRSRCRTPPDDGVRRAVRRRRIGRASTTMAFSRLTRNLVRDPQHRSADRADHPGRGAHLRHGPALQGGRHLQPARPALHAGRQGAAALLPREGRTGRSWRRASPRPARWPTSPPPAPRYADHGRADDPVLHLLLDVRLPAHRRPGLGLRRRARPRLHDGRHRRPHHAHRRGAPARRRAQPHPGQHRAQRARLRPRLRLRAGDHRARGDPAHVRRGAARTSSTTSPSTTRTGRCRPSPMASRRGSCAACTASGRPSEGSRTRAAAGVGLDPAPGAPGAGAPRRALRRRRRRVERPVLPAAAQRRALRRALESAAPRGRGSGCPYVVQQLGPTDGPIIAATDYLKALPDMVARWIDRPFTVARAPMASAAATRARRCACTSR